MAKKIPTTTTAPTGQIAPFGLRMLPELRDKIEAAAKASGRSMNAEVVARLERSFSSNETWSDLGEIAPLRDEAMLRMKIATLVMKGGTLGYGILLIRDWLAHGQELTPHQESQLRQIERLATEAIDAAEQGAPEQAIAHLREVQAQAVDLARQLRANAAATDHMLNARTPLADAFYADRPPADRLSFERSSSTNTRLPAAKKR